MSRSELPAEFTNWSIPGGCPSTTGGFIHVTGPTPAPLGVGSLELDDINGADIPLLYDASTQSPAATDLTRFVIRTHEDASSTVELHALIYTVSSVFPLNIPATGGWVTTNVLTASGSSGTWSQFLADNPGATIQQLGVKLEGCQAGAAATANVDDLEVGFNGHTTRFDFEPATAPAGILTGHLNHHALLAGQSVTPSASVTYGGAGVVGVPVNLLAKAAGATSFRKVAGGTTNSTGSVVEPAQRLSVTTSYEWQVPSGADVAATTSSPSKVTVASKLSINLDRSRVKKGKKFHATGVMTPKHAGDLITLFATKHGHTRKVATGKVRSDGSYAIAGRLKRAGHYLVFTTATADASNAKGTSPKKKLTVH